MEFDSLALNQL